MIVMRKIGFIGIFLLSIIFADAQIWRSSLYPEDWTPGYKDSEGRFLHDFSYAGYHSGLKEIPNRTDNIIDITKAPYNADNKGKKDVTFIVQKAVNDLGEKGGGVVYFPQGEYAMSVSTGGKNGVLISYDNIVLRGAGPGKTFLKNTTTSMRNKTLINFEAKNGKWSTNGKKTVKITKDLYEPTFEIPVEDVADFKVGDIILIKTDCTEEFIKEHKSEGLWTTGISGVSFNRFIVGIDKKKKILRIDAPTRYFMKKRDNARVCKLGKQLEECGIENLSIGNIQHSSNEDWNIGDAYTKEGTGAYDVHGSHLINFSNALNCWAYRIHTYRPKENKDDIHTLSNCMKASRSRFITMKNCNLQRSQYEGGGGNGYMFTFYDCNDCLIISSHAEHSRHNYDFKGFSSNGNVIYNCTSRNPKYPSDFHMFLSMANLIDSFVSDGDYIDARFRPWGDPKRLHSYSTTESVIWNIKSIKGHKVGFIVDSRQWGWGYVIGTSGDECRVKTTPVKGEISGNGVMRQYDGYPEDFVEGEGKGDYLVPQSLYIDQLKKRLERLKKAK